MKWCGFGFIYILLFTYLYLTRNINAQPIDNVVEVSYPTGNQIMFRDEGVVANQLGFIHVKTEIDIKKVYEDIVEFNNSLNNLIKEEIRKHKLSDVKQLYSNLTDFEKAAKSEEIFYGNQDFDSLVIYENIQNKLLFMWSEFEDILLTLPRKEGQTLVSQNMFHQKFKKDVSRYERSVMTGLLFGIPGTIMGFMNQVQILSLNNRVGNIEEKYNNLVDITNDHGKVLEKLSLGEETLRNMIFRLSLANKSKLIAYCETFFIRFQSVFNRLSSAIDSAQNHRLSSRAINGQELVDLFVFLKNEALKVDSDLFLEHPSDLYQIDTSYLFDISRFTFTLLIHVPMVPKMQQLTLQRYLPFPMTDSFTVNATVFPELGEKVYLASNSKDEYRIMSQADLLSCTKRGTLHLCLGRNSLRTDLGYTCLGGLLMKNMESVRKYCRLVSQAPQEYVVGLNHAEWLISTPTEFSTNVICGGKSTRVPLKNQSRLKIKSGCKVELNENILTTDKSRNFNAGVFVVDWIFDESLFMGQSKKEVNERMEEFKKLGQKLFKATDLTKLKINANDNFSYHISIGLIGCVIMLIVIISSCCYWQTKKVNRLKNDLNDRGGERPVRKKKTMMKWKAIHKRMMPRRKIRSKFIEEPKVREIHPLDEQRNPFQDFNVRREVAKVEAPPLYSAEYSFEIPSNNASSSRTSSLYPQLKADSKPSGKFNSPYNVSANRILGKGCNVTMGSRDDVSQFICTSHNPEEGCSGAFPE